MLLTYLPLAEVGVVVTDLEEEPERGRQLGKVVFTLGEQLHQSGCQAKQTTRLCKTASYEARLGREPPRGRPVLEGIRLKFPQKANMSSQISIEVTQI